METMSMSALNDEDPELLRAALEIIEAWDDCESSVNGVAVASPLTDEGLSSHDGDCDDDCDEFGVVGDLFDFSNGAAHPERPLLPDSVGMVNAATPKKANASPTASSSSPVSSTASSSPTASLSKPARRAKTVKPSTEKSTQHRRREEIVYLKEKIKDLESQLTTLKEHKNGKSGASTANVIGLNDAMTAVWQDMALRQQRMREKAELEQTKLRKVLETQVKVAQGLVKLMQKARRLESEEEVVSAKRPRMAFNTSLAIQDSDQFARVERLYNEIEGAFTFSKFQDGTLKFIDVKLVDENEDEVAVEIRDAWAVPFDTDQVMNAMWLYSIRKTERKSCRPDHEMSYTVDEDTIFSNFTASAKTDSIKSTFDGKIVTKRFTASNQPLAIVHNMYGEPSRHRPDDTFSIYLQEDGWIRLLPIDPVGEANSLSHNRHSMTLVQTMRRFRIIYGDESSSTGRRYVGQLTDLLLENLTEEVQFKHETVETVLLQSRS